MRTALAYYNWGRFVCDCPEPGCDDARLVYHPQTGERQTQDVCAAGHPFAIQMPSPTDEAAIVTALADRANDADKSWYPDGFARAIALGQPTGQSPRELVAEGKQVAKLRTAEQQREQERRRELLTQLGVAVRPDGTFEGSL